jgi:UDP-N-acetylglucosamine acyltransferase
VSVAIHVTAVVDPTAELGDGVEIGPYAVVGPQVVLAEDCRLGPHVVLERNVRLGARVRVGAGSVLGSAPQDAKYDGEESWVEIGDDTVIREHCTVNRGTAARGRTLVGPGCFLMTSVHVAHDCVLGQDVTIANATQLSGHVTIEEHASLSGLVAVHQFVTIGAHAFIGGASRIPQDIPPYLMAVGNPVKLYGLNTVGLERAGFSPQTLAALRQAYRLLFRTPVPRADAIRRLRAEAATSPEVLHLVEFIGSSRRGVPA